MKQEIPYARYDYAVQPREVDLTKRATIITLGDSILHTAGEDADRIGFGIRNLQSKDSTWVLSRMAVEIDRLPAEYERYTVGTWVGEIGPSDDHPQFHRHGCRRTTDRGGFHPLGDDRREDPTAAGSKR